MSRPAWLTLRRVALVAILAVAATGVVLVLTGSRSGLICLSAQPEGIMNTDVDLLVVVPAGQESQAQDALDQAEKELRRIEDLMSPYKEGSDVWRLNAAKAGQTVRLSSETMDVLEMGRQLAANTKGALDVTCGAMLQLWKDAGKRKAVPTPAEIAAAKANVGFDKLELGQDFAVKQVQGLKVDLSAIAKKYAIDKAIERMKQAGVTGGRVNIGGDLRVFGRPTKGDTWLVEIVDPFDNNPDLDSRRKLGTLAIRDAAVITSGNYERYVTINGRTYSHIVDPRTGKTCDGVPSVTVVGPEAICGTWATALSVLGWQGHTLMPAGTMAMVVEGNAKSHWIHCDQAFANLLQDKSVIKQWSTTTHATPNVEATTQPTSEPTTASAPASK